MKKSIIAGISTVCLLTAACSQTEDMPKEPVICPVEPGELVIPSFDWSGARSLKEVAHGNVGKANTFATNLLRTIYKAKLGNTCVSPASVFCTFAMMANGDDGECRDEILNMLGYGDGPDALNDLNVYANALLKETSQFDGDTQCGFTNSIWHHPNVNVLPGFASDIEGIFGGMIFPTWLGDDSGMATINQFVCDQTRGMIPRFLQEPLEVRLAFLNTTYFKGSWKTSFDKELTADKEFRDIRGSRTRIPFMTTRENLLRYSEINGTRAVSLPYDGDRYNMIIFQPLTDTRDAFENFLNAIDDETILEYETAMQQKMVILTMPKFDTESNADILPQLQEMGIDRTCRQGLYGVADEQLCLCVFQHAVKITVDEEGTEGGAASLGGMMNSADPWTPKPTTVSIDSPFIYFIRDNISGTVLFMGAVTSF